MKTNSIRWEKRIQKTLITSLLSFGTIASAYADSKLIHLGKVEVVGYDESTKTTFISILENEIASREAFNYQGRSENSKDARIEASLNKLERNTLVQIRLVEEGRAPIIRSMKASSMDEVDLTVRRMLTAIAENISVPATQEFGQITNLETARPTRVRPAVNFKPSFGAAYSLTDALDTHGPLYTAGFAVSWQLEDFMVEGRVDAASGYEHKQHAYVLSAMVGGHYFFYSTRKIGLFAGAEMGLASFEARNGLPDDTHGGMIASFDLGALLLRHSRVGLEIRIRNQVIAAKLNDSVPVLTGLSAGITF